MFWRHPFIFGDAFISHMFSPLAAMVVPLGEDGGISAKLRKEGYRLCRHLADGENRETTHVAFEMH